MSKRGKSHCYTYFVIIGDFNPDSVTEILGLQPFRIQRIGDRRRDGETFDFASWEYGMCDQYNVDVTNQMMKTIQDLVPKIDELLKIKQLYAVDFYLEIVPYVYIDEIKPILAPNKEIIEFCYKSQTEIDLDLYVCDAFSELN